MRNLTTFILLLLAVAANARQISPDEAAAIASDFLNSSSLQIANARRIDVKRARAKSDTEDKFTSPYYVFNGEGNQGFVIISGDDRAKKILGYSDTGNFDFDNLSPQLAAMLDQYAEQIASLPESAAADPSWSAPPRDASTEEGKLLETANWGQGYPYNAQCPVIDGVQCPTGCVATAMAIVMKYHNWPECGRKTHTYWNGYTGQMHSTDFSNFHPQWEAMLPAYKEGEYSEENAQAVAELMLHAGMATNMQYSATESGTGVLGVMTALRRFFNYTAKMDEVVIEQYGNDEWETRVREDIDNDCPVFYYGEGTGAHAFVIDGYAANTLFHVNWGWNGSANGYFTLDNLSPEGWGWDFSNNPGMVAGIHPATKEDEMWSDFFMADDKYFGSISPLKKINPSVENITQNTPFTVAIPLVAFPPGVTFDLGVAIVDKDHLIKQVLGHRSMNSTWVALSGDMPTYENLVVTCPVDDTDRIQIVVKEQGESGWHLVCDSKDIKSSISIANNVPYTATVHWDVDPRLGVEFYEMEQWSGNIIPSEDINNTFGKFLIGARYQFHPYGADANVGIFSAIKINDVISDIMVNKAFTMGDVAIGVIAAQPGNYDIKIMGLFPGDERTSSLEINKEGDLQRFVKDNECAHITDFTLSGIGTDDDYFSISNNMPFIAKLDMSAYKPAEGKLPDECFAGLPNLSKVNLPENLDTIGARCFTGDALDNITIPSNVTYIGDEAFNNYSGYFDNVNLSAVFCKATTPPNVGHMPFGNNSRTVLYVLPGCKEAYSSHPYWSTFSKVVEDDNPIMDIDEIVVDGIRYKVYSDYAEVIGPEKDNCPDEVTLQESVVSNGRTVPVTGIAYHAFVYSSLKKVTVPESIVNWATGAFSCSYDLTDAVIKAPIKELPTNTFENCSNLTNLELPNTIEVLGQYAISSSYNIKKIQIPTSLKELQWNSVRDLPGLEEIILPEENKNFNLIDGVLYSKDMTWLYLYPSGDNTRERFVIPEGVTNTFEALIGGENLHEVIIPNSMTELAEDFIRYAPNLETLVLHDGITTISKFCFSMPKYLTLGKNLWKWHPQYIINHGTYHIYCNNEQALTDFGFNLSYINNETNDTINYYSGHLTPNIIISSEYSTGSHLYIPGNANWEESNFKKENVHYMWDYHFNRTLQAFSLTNILPDVEILGVKVNGEYVNKTNGLYHYSGNGAPDVTIEYRLHGRQVMTTDYTSEFNNTLPDTDLTKAQKITLDKSNLELYVGQSLQLSAVVTPESAINKAIEWSSNNHEVVTVDQYGNVSAVAQGTATITATATDGSGVSATCHVTVSPVLVESLTLSPDSWSGIEGDTFQITATLMPDNATNKTIEWTTSDAAVATVDSAGVVSVLKAGSCVITASTVDGSNLTAECIITGPTGIDSMFADGMKVDVYNANGVLLKRGCGKTELKSLAPGVYIVRDKNKAKTIIIY